jgi:tetratricopeptide (TPR) repeat protein
MLEKKNSPIILLLFVILGCQCNSSKVEALNQKREKLKQIIFSANSCDSIHLLNEMVNDAIIDSAIIEEVSMLYFECDSARKSINTMLMLNLIKDKYYSQDELLRLCETYRKIGYTDSALFYLQLFEQNCIRPDWYPSRFLLWKMQINFEGGRYKNAINYANLALKSPDGIEEFRSDWPHEYIAQSYFYLGESMLYCEYAEKYAPRVFSRMICDSVKELKHSIGSTQITH